ncbi:MAG TPA: GntR family transcriptional regulator [Kofleriaceae bacterium]|nr:GntR family transcriptional regulator [Kofleriaceae bacterium]
MTKLKLRPASTIETIFEAILAEIVRGKYPPGARLPAERELSRAMGASRPTLREALRRLAEWKLIEAKRGSGVVVRDRNEWSIEVLPAYIRYARPGPGEASIAQLLHDLLTIRRTVIREMILMVAGRIPSGATSAAREQVARAWAARADLRQFTIEDFGVMRAVVEAGHFLPAVWLLNRLSAIYLDIAQSLTGTMAPPENYTESHGRFLDALENSDGARAATLMDGYLDAHDREILKVLEVFL